MTREYTPTKGPCCLWFY